MQRRMFCIVFLVLVFACPLLAMEASVRFGGQLGALTTGVTADVVTGSFAFDLGLHYPPGIWYLMPVFEDSGSWVFPLAGSLTADLTYRILLSDGFMIRLGVGGLLLTDFSGEHLGFLGPRLMCLYGDAEDGRTVFFGLTLPVASFSDVGSPQWNWNPWLSLTGFFTTSIGFLYDIPLGKKS